MLIVKWIGMFLCLLQSGMFSGLNLGFFGLSRLRLEVESEANDENAKRILKLRKNAHFLLATLLWGNVSSNVLLTMITDSVFAGVGAFLFSTVFITFFGEIIPQAYFSRYALKSSVVLVPIIRFYQMLLYPIARPTGYLLDKWLGKESIHYFNEDEFKIMLKRHAQSGLTDVGQLESLGAANFLSMDDIKIKDEGEIINPKSIIPLPTKAGLPVFPHFNKEPKDPFLQKIHESQEKWVIITDFNNVPQLVLNADQFLRDVLYENEISSLYSYCHRPVVVSSSNTNLGQVIFRLKVQAEHKEDDVIDNDLILYWNDEKRIITGADILGRLLRGIVVQIPKDK